MTFWSEQYDIELFHKLDDHSSWPAQFDPNPLVSFLADKADISFIKWGIEWHLVSVLIWWQICEEMIRSILELSNLYVQGQIWPNRITFELDKKATFWLLIKKLKSWLDFKDKGIFIEKCEALCELRNDFIHKLLKFNWPDEIKQKATEVRLLFQEIKSLNSNIVEMLWNDLIELNMNVTWAMPGKWKETFL